MTSLATTHLVLNSGCSESPNATLLDALPEEIVVRILEWCDIGGMLACQRTCRAFRNIIEGSVILRYKIALSENGMCDEPRSRIPMAEKLELLAAHTAAWRDLHTVTVQPEWVASLAEWSSPVAVSGNIIVFTRAACKGVNGEHEAYAHHTPTAPPTGAHIDLLVVRVPSQLCLIEGAQWMIWLPESVYKLCIDAAQDLLIYELDHTISVRTLSTGVVHPFVVGHSGCFKLWEGDWDLSSDVFDLCVRGDYIAANTRIYFISIWNWKTGELVSYQTSNAAFSPFDFLDEHHILYADSSEDSVYIYDLRCGIDVTGNRNLKAKPGHRCFRLELPPIDRATKSRYIQIRPNMSPIRIQDQELHGNGDGSQTSPPPFHVDPRERLVVLLIATHPTNFGEEPFELLVRAQALLEPFAVKRNPGAVVPWSVWRTDTSVIPLSMEPYLPRSRMVTYGMRTVSPPDWEEGVLYLYSYTPRKAGAAGSVAGTRQGIPLPDESLENVWEESEDQNVFSTLCEDGLLLYQLNLPLNTILDAYWFTPRVQ